MVVKTSHHLMIIPAESVPAQLRGSSPSSLVADNPPLSPAASSQNDRDPAQLRQELNKVRAQIAQHIATLSALDVQHSFALNDVVGYLNSTITIIGRAIDRIR
jgi:hypothetical protein